MVSKRQLFLRHVAQTSGQSLQFDIDRAEGIYFISSGGRRYIDLVSGVSVSALGHGNLKVIEAIREQSSAYLHTMVYGEFMQSPQVSYAHWLAERLPKGLDNVFFVNSGSEAIDGAIKLAKRTTGRTDIRAFEKSYHGGTCGAFSILGDDKTRSGYLPLLPGVKHLRFNCLEDLDLIDSSVAAVIMEPIQAEAGIIEPVDNYLGEVRKRCDRSGALMVLDEIQTGMGRTGRLWAFEHYGVRPDILCLAKSFGGGMPLGAFIAPREIMKQLTFDPPLGHITTFGGHPVSCAAGLAAQKVVEEEGLMRRALILEKQFRKGLIHSLIKEIRGRGLFLSVVVDRSVNVPAFIEKAYENGLVMDQFLYSSDAFRIAPPLIVTDEEAEEIIGKVLASLDAML